MARREKKKAAKVDLDMTPMIDVVFQLIIFFILTMTVTNPDLKSVTLPTGLTALEEDPTERIAMLHMYNDYNNYKGSNVTAANDPGLSDPDKQDHWHVTLGGDDRRFIPPHMESPASKPSESVGTILKDLSAALESRAKLWKPGKVDIDKGITETTRSIPGSSELAYNMPILVRGDMRAPIILFASIVKACETAKIYRMQVSIAPPPDELAGN